MTVLNLGRDRVETNLVFSLGLKSTKWPVVKTFLQLKLINSPVSLKSTLVTLNNSPAFFTSLYQLNVCSSEDGFLCRILNYFKDTRQKWNYSFIVIQKSALLFYSFLTNLSLARLCNAYINMIGRIAQIHIISFRLHKMLEKMLP